MRSAEQSGWNMLFYVDKSSTPMSQFPLGFDRRMSAHSRPAQSAMYVLLFVGTSPEASGSSTLLLRSVSV